MWIAFKNYYLRDTKQPCRWNSRPPKGCELLSKIIIFVTRNNQWSERYVCAAVVNCFQKLLSSWHETTAEKSWFIFPSLWIAFKNYYLRDTKQPSSNFGNVSYSCELLSKIIIFVTRNNDSEEIIVTDYVVNCFQKLLSSWHETTKLFSAVISNSLWIAFKNYYLRDTKQQTWKIYLLSSCCELLSKIIIFVTRNNTRQKNTGITTVVNCFQKLLSSWHETTSFCELKIFRALWIAFKNYYLRDTKQPENVAEILNACCELLSKIIIFVTRNNRCGSRNHHHRVVNCFQKLLSSWHETTASEIAPTTP